MTAVAASECTKPPTASSPSPWLSAASVAAGANAPRRSSTVASTASGKAKGAAAPRARATSTNHTNNRSASS